VENCATDLGSLLELGRNQPLPPSYQKYTLNHLQGLYTNKLLLKNIDESTKEQMVKFSSDIFFIKDGKII
jgi:hypothetical protein